MGLIKKLADTSSYNSLSNKFRRKRFRLFLKIIGNIPRPLRILDIGGTLNFWQNMNFTPNNGISITILNLEIPEKALPGFNFVKGDAKDLSIFKDKEFDIIFSNSVIEHVGNFDSQKKMAGEIIRAGKRYFIQTPNYSFPFEPHFLFPFFQFLPQMLRVFLLTHFNLGWFNKCSTKNEALKLINGVNLLNKSKLTSLFSNGILYRETFLFLTKSFIIYSQ
jgi:hypothetical protein